MKYKTTIITMSIHLEGENPVFSESATHVSIYDEAGSPFLVIKQNGKAPDEIRLDFEELDVIVEAAKKLQEQIDPYDFR